MKTPGRDPFVCVSMYSPWTRPHASTDSSWIVSDASAHRIVSDLSALIGRQNDHRIVAAGDLNILHGYGDHGSAYWAKRYETVFTRMKALRLPFVGPHAPNGRQGESVARRATQAQRERADLPHESPDAGHGDAPVRLRFRF